MIISNPPIRAAGKKSCIAFFSRGLANHLVEEGQLVIVIQKNKGPEAQKKMQEVFGMSNALHSIKGIGSLCANKGKKGIEMEKIKERRNQKHQRSRQRRNLTGASSLATILFIIAGLLFAGRSDSHFYLQVNKFVASNITLKPK